MRGALDIKRGGGKQDSSTAVGRRRWARSSCLGWSSGLQGALTCSLTSTRAGQALGWLEWGALMLIFMRFPKAASTSLSPYLCLILSALLLSVHFPFSCLVPHLCLCLLLNLEISLFFCVLVSSPFCDTIFVLGCAIYIF